MSQSEKNLDNFTTCADRLDLPKVEEFVREKISNFAKSCPKKLLGQLAKCVINYRRNELFME